MGLCVVVMFVIMLLVFFNTFLVERCGHVSCFKFKTQHCTFLVVDLVPLQVRETVGF